MSAETRQKIREAIEEHVADEWEGPLVVDFTIALGMIDGEGDFSAGLIHSRDPMPRYVARGLLAEGLHHLDVGDE